METRMNTKHPIRLKLQFPSAFEKSCSPYHQLCQVSYETIDVITKVQITPSEFKPVKFCSKIDPESHPSCAEGLGQYMYRY